MARSLRLILAAALAALVLSAGLGVSSASALPTALCKVKESVCAKANQYEKPWLTLYTTESWGETNVTLTPSGFSAIKCVEEKFTNNTMEPSGTGPMVGTMWNVVPVSGCGASCNVEITNSPKLELEQSGKNDGNGTLRVKSPIFEARCSAAPVYRCYYTTATFELSLQGGEVATAKNSGATLARTTGPGETFACPLKATASASLRFVSPASTVYVTSG
jgi:hypothetical protein